VDIESIRNWVATIALILSTTSLIVTWVKSPGEKVAKKLDEFADGLKKHDRRIQAVEDEMKHLPTSDEFSELKVCMAEVKGDVERVQEMVTWLKSTVQSMDNYLRAKP
jgi:hypothetical protein